jgi:hypothetical protein
MSALAVWTSPAHLELWAPDRCRLWRALRPPRFHSVVGLSRLLGRETLPRFRRWVLVAMIVVSGL